MYNQLRLAVHLSICHVGRLSMFIEIQGSKRCLLVQANMVDISYDNIRIHTLGRLYMIATEAINGDDSLNRNKLVQDACPNALANTGNPISKPVDAECWRLASAEAYYITTIPNPHNRPSTIPKRPADAQFIETLVPAPLDEEEEEDAAEALIECDAIVFDIDDPDFIEA